MDQHQEREISQLPPRTIIEEVLPSLARGYPDLSGSINAVLAIELTGDRGGSWSLDLTGVPTATAGLREDARCLIRMDADHFIRLLSTGKIAPWLTAFTQRLIVVEGDMPLALKLGQILTSAAKGDEAG